MVVRKQTDGKRREEKDGCLVSCERRNFLAEPFTIDMFLSFLLGDERVDKIEVSQVLYKHSIRVTREV